MCWKKISWCVGLLDYRSSWISLCSTLVIGARSKEQGTKSKEQGARNKEQGVRSKEQGIKCKTLASD
ncbi:MAG: hypothetical protein EOO89_17080 [Pedobacter sp.]|nr:MAG: hypothetical protein EOO89_17080 [Pedobacter sp.]